MKHFILIAFVAVNFHVKAQQVEKTYYDAWNTKIMEEYQVNTAGINNGFYKKYGQDGQLIYKGNYNNGQKDGEWIQYTTYTGKSEIAKRQHYKDDLLNGTSISYGQGGIVLDSGTYKNDLRDGKWLQTGQYNNYDLSKEELKGCEYYRYHVLYSKGEMIHSDIQNPTIQDGEHRVMFYPSGKTYYLMTFKDGVKVSTTAYFPTGAIESVIAYSSNGGILDTKEYYPTGQLKVHRNYENGVETYEGFEKDGSPNRQMLYFKQEQEKQRVTITILKADSLLLQNGYQEAVALYESVKQDHRFADEVWKIRTAYVNLEIDYNNYLSQLKNLRFSDRTEYAPAGQIAYCEHLIKKVENTLLVHQTLVAEITDAVKTYTATYGAPNYLRGRFIYEKSSLVLTSYYNDYNAEKNLARKIELGNIYLKALKRMNEIPETDCKFLNKQLKKITDPGEIKTILNI